MKRRVSAFVVMICFVSLGAFGQSAQPLVSSLHVDSKSDKVLFALAMNAMMESKYAMARTLLVTLITTYPESANVPSAKVTVADAWYAEGNLKQAEIEYRDFITFFPNRPEAAQARLKIESIRARTGL